MTKVAAKHEQSAVAAMYAGLALTVGTLIVPYIDHATANVLADPAAACSCAARTERESRPC